MSPVTTPCPRTASPSLPLSRDAIRASVGFQELAGGLRRAISSILFCPCQPVSCVYKEENETRSLTYHPLAGDIADLPSLGVGAGVLGARVGGRLALRRVGAGGSGDGHGGEGEDGGDELHFDVLVLFVCLKGSLSC